MKKNKEEFLKVRKIENGIVIDHVPHGKALKVLLILGLNSNFPATVSMLMNVPSSGYGLKDIIKIEGKELNKKELDKIALIAPYATINIVKNYKVIEKYRAKIPDFVESVFKCPNPNCITNKEGSTKFSVKERNPLRLQCYYCEKVYAEEDFQLT